jgi:hypothetical protein
MFNSLLVMLTWARQVLTRLEVKVIYREVAFLNNLQSKFSLQWVSNCVNPFFTESRSWRKGCRGVIMSSLYNYLGDKLGINAMVIFYFLAFSSFKKLVLRFFMLTQPIPQVPKICQYLSHLFVKSF